MYINLATLEVLIQKLAPQAKHRTDQYLLIVALD